MDVFYMALIHLNPSFSNLKRVKPHLRKSQPYRSPHMGTAAICPRSIGTAYEESCRHILAVGRRNAPVRQGAIIEKLQYLLIFGEAPGLFVSQRSLGSALKPTAIPVGAEVVPFYDPHILLHNSITLAPSLKESPSVMIVQAKLPVAVETA